MQTDPKFKDSGEKSTKDGKGRNIKKRLQVENRYEGMHRTQDGVEESKHKWMG